ncbi:MAG TPA: methyltransferase [Acidimicrobiales bacterium]
MTQPALGPRDLLGVPMLPPGWVTSRANRVRALVGRAHRSAAPPPVQILESLLGALDAAALGALCECGIVDALDRRMTVDELASVTATSRPELERLVRYASARGWLQVDRRGGVAPNATTTFLRRDHPGGWRAWVDFTTGADVNRALAHLASAVRDGSDAFEAANGAPFFEWMALHPERGAAFDGAMAAGGAMHGIVLAQALDWSDARRVCDVGGGTGALLGTLLDAVPTLTGVLFDLPPVVERARSHPRMAAVAGDAFATVPSDCDTYLFVNVVHDWGDDDAVRLLSTVAANAPSRARVVIVEGEPRTPPIDEIATRSDLLMMALAPGGRERTREEVAILAGRAGWRVATTTALASGDFAHVLLRSP